MKYADDYCPFVPPGSFSAFPGPALYLCLHLPQSLHYPVCICPPATGWVFANERRFHRTPSTSYQSQRAPNISPSIFWCQSLEANHNAQALDRIRFTQGRGRVRSSPAVCTSLMRLGVTATKRKSARCLFASFSPHHPWSLRY